LSTKKNHDIIYKNVDSKAEFIYEKMVKMKVLSLTEPYASLILKGKKEIETRSWNTSYRGELYIHASRTKIKKDVLENKELMKLTNNDYNFGHIICKCDLKDCILMTESYIKNIKEEHREEYLCGEYKEGRYAWILENITPIIQIKAKGKLGIWNYYNEKEIMNLMNEISYGWIDKKNKMHEEIDDSFSDNYVLQSPKEVIKNKMGICWDQVELERFYFEKNEWNIKTYFLVHYDNARCPTHTFLTYEKNKKYYWFEHSWEPFRGIHEYSSLKELLLDVREKFIKIELHQNYDKNNLCLHEYKKPNYHMSVKDFYDHCDSGPFIDIEKL